MRCLTYNVPSDTGGEVDECHSEPAECALKPTSNPKLYNEVDPAVQYAVVQENSRAKPPMLTEAARAQA